MSEQKNIGIDRPSFLQRLVKQKMALVGGIVILLWLLVGLVSFFYTPYGPNEVNMAEKLMAPGAGHLMGTDNFGRDILSRMMCGARISLLLGFVAVCISLCIGIPLGAFSGYYEGKAGNLIMRVMDSLQAFPMLILVMSISVALGRNSFSAMLAVGIAGIPNFARLMYAQTLSVKQSAFIEGEHAIGLPRPSPAWCCPSICSATACGTPWTTGRSKIVGAVRRRDVCGFLAFSVCEPVVHGTGPLPGEPESDS